MAIRNARTRLVTELEIEGFSDQDLDALTCAVRVADFGEDVSKSVCALSFAMKRFNGMHIIRSEFDAFWAEYEQQKHSDVLAERDIHGIKAT